MADVVSPEKRSQMMAGIRAKNTRPEMLVRRGLHNLGFRFQLHRKNLPGRPDLVFPRYKAALFVQGCFWHGHGCHLFKWPKSRMEFWRTKIEGNVQRDKAMQQQLRKMGWRVGIIWECSVKGRTRLASSEVLDNCRIWLLSSEANLEMAGCEAGVSV